MNNDCIRCGEFSRIRMLGAPKNKQVFVKFDGLDEKKNIILYLKYNQFTFTLHVTSSRKTFFI